LASLPEAVTDAPAATLPVAGLTALHALRQGGLLLGRKVLVDGASGGVGHLAVASGARVYGQVRRPKFRATVAEWCGERVVLGADLDAAAPPGPFLLILDSVGGSALAAALTILAPGGICVHFGVSESPTSTIASRDFSGTGGVKLYGLMLFKSCGGSSPRRTGLRYWLASSPVECCGRTSRSRPHGQRSAPSPGGSWTARSPERRYCTSADAKTAGVPPACGQDASVRHVTPAAARE
jgi:hypothetical protein